MSSQPGPEGARPPGTVTVPSWVGVDWTAAALVALRAYAVMFLVGLLSVVTLLLLAMIQSSLGSLDLGDVLIAPFAQPLDYLGGHRDGTVMLTGVAVLVAGLVWGLRSAPAPVGDRSRLFAFAGKVGLVMAGGLLVVAIVADIFGLAPRGLSTGFGLGGRLEADYVRIVFLIGPIVALATVAAVALHTRTAPGALVGVPGSVPAMVRTSWAGLVHTLKIALVGLLVLFALGRSLQLLTEGSQPFDDRLGGVIGTLVGAAILSALDVATVFLVSAMSFLRYDALGEATAWHWVGVALVAVAFFLGGRTAAARANPTTQVQAVTAASLVGVLLSAVMVVVAIAYAAIGGSSEFAVPAIFLPLLWTIPAVAGAWFHASELRLPSGVVTNTDPAAEPRPGPPPAAGPSSPPPAAATPTEPAPMPQPRPEPPRSEPPRTVTEPMGYETPPPDPESHEDPFERPDRPEGG